MGKEGREVPFPEKVWKVFCALVVTVKRSVDELFMHFFSKRPSASMGALPADPIGALSLDPSG